MSEESPFTNRELKKYFEDFRNDLKEIKDDIANSRIKDHQRFADIEKDIVHLKVWKENIGVKMAAITFIVSATVAGVIKQLFP